MPSSDPKSFVTTLSNREGSLLKQNLDDLGFAFTNTPHAQFTACKPQLRCTLYTSGKLVAQGKGVRDFIEFILEPVLGKFFELKDPEQKSENRPSLVMPSDTRPKIGQDETGKGDLFGPLCVAAVYISERERRALERHKIRDSKTIKAKPLKLLAKEIKAICPNEILILPPPLYNARYNQCNNLNTLLAQAHAQVFEALFKATGCDRVLVDQFASPSVLLKAFKDGQLPTSQLEQKVRAESDLAVASASILAREAFVDWMDSTSEAIDFLIPKGAGSDVFKAAQKIYSERGEKILQTLTKWHFKTIKEVLGTPIDSI